MIGLSLREAMKRQREEAANGRDCVIYRERETFRYYLLPVRSRTTSIWDTLLKGAEHDGSRANQPTFQSQPKR
jgi:hypothetical protein